MSDFLTNPSLKPDEIRIRVRSEIFRASFRKYFRVLKTLLFLDTHLELHNIPTMAPIRVGLIGLSSGTGETSASPGGGWAGTYVVDLFVLNITF